MKRTLFAALGWASLLLLIPLLGGCAGGAPEPTTGNSGSSVDSVDPQVIIDVDRQRAAAMIDPDPDRLNEVFHDALTYSHSNGRVEGKFDFIERLVTGAVNYNILNSPEPSVWVEGATAIVTGPMTFQLSSGARSFDLTAVYTAVYVQNEGRWQLVAYHSSPKRLGS